MRLAEPYWLVLIVLAVVPWLWERGRARVSWPSLGGFERGPRAWAGWPRHAPALLRGAAIACLAVAMARPRTVGGIMPIRGRGVAIVAAIDQSSSMTAADFPADGGPIGRLEAAQRTFARFVAGRPDDLIGLVAFANDPDLACPPTLDHAHLLRAARALRPARPGDDGTNLGDAIAWALDALRRTSPRKKVLILLTDGLNEPAVPNPTDPVAAATLARDLGVTLHTIAIGRAGPPAPGQAQGPDLALLRRLAEIGGGRAYVAAAAKDLDDVFRRIDALETSRISGAVRVRYHEAYAPWVAAALALLVIDRVLAGGRLRRVP